MFQLIIIVLTTKSTFSTFEKGGAKATFQKSCAKSLVPPF